MIRKVRSQTGCELITLPSEVKKHLGVKAKDFVYYEILEDGRVVIGKAKSENEK